MNQETNKEEIILTKHDDDGKSEIELRWNNNSQNMKINIKSSDNSCSFDDLYDFIIDKIEKEYNNDIEVVLDSDKQFNEETRINEFSVGLKEIINKEIKEIQNEIKKLQETNS